MVFLNLKKIVAISNNFPNCTLPRRSIVSWFVFGFVTFFVFLFIICASSLSRDEVVERRDFVNENVVTVSPNLRNYSSSFGECDIFDGRWVRDDTKPYYPPGLCPYVDGVFNCHRYQRPDIDFVKWRWQPFGCDIPRFSYQKILYKNMWESLVCILGRSVKNKNKVYEISGRKNFHKRGYYAFRFEDYNCTVGFVKSPFLVMESSLNSKKTLRLDLMESSSTPFYHDANILIFNTGRWWTHEKTLHGKGFYQEGNFVHPRLELLSAYTKALSTWAKWVDNNIDTRATQVIFVGDAPTHYSGGQWNSGGQCHNETKPIFNTSQLTKYSPKMQAFDNVLLMMKTPVIYLNISKLTDYRKDGHPSIYRTWRKSQKRKVITQQLQDCSHWCLPGVPDTWNELLYASLLKAGR